MYKNVAGQHTFAVVIEASTGNPKTSGVDFYITKDDGVQAAADSSTHVGNGQWRIAFTQAETDADVVGLSWSGTDVVANGMTFYPVTKKVSDLIDAAAAPSAATVASQVRTELGTELGRIDVAISSRNATTPPTVGAIRTELEGAGTKLTDIHGKLPFTYIADADTLNGITSILYERLTEARAGYLDKLNVSGTLAHSNAANTYKADVSGLATSAQIAALHNFDPASDKVIVVTNEDKTGYELTSGERTNIATSVWSATTRTLSSFGSLVADAAIAVWAAATRTLTGTQDVNVTQWRGEQPNALATGKVQADASVSLGEEDIDAIAEATATEVGGAVAEGVWAAENRSLTDKANFTLASSEHTSIATAVWATTTRTLSSFGSLVADMAAAVWAYAGRALTVNPPTAAAIRSELDTNSTKLELVNVATAQLASTLESDGKGGHRFTADALENVPTSEPEWTPEEKAAALAALAQLIVMGKCDIVTNTTTTPWREEYRNASTSELLYYKHLYKLDGSPITSINDYAAYKVENELP